MKIIKIFNNKIFNNFQNFKIFNNENFIFNNEKYLKE